MMKKMINATTSSSTMDMIFSEIHVNVIPPKPLVIANFWFNKYRHKADISAFRRTASDPARKIFVFCNAVLPPR